MKKQISINWLLKALIFKFLSAFNLISVVNFLSKYVTKRSSLKFDADFYENLSFHNRNISSSNSKNIIEIGAGKSFAQNIFLSSLKIHQTIIDRANLGDFSLINKAAKKFSGNENFSIRSKEDLSKYFSIKYIAPCDLKDLAINKNRFDCFISTNTFEHIPIRQIENIMINLKEILVTGSKLSIIIDYSDHYSHTDQNINKLHFLKYSEKVYNRLFNSNLHYQNRLRHDDFEKIFIENGFKIVHSQATECYERPKKIKAIKRNLKKNDFCTKGFFLLEA